MVCVKCHKYKFGRPRFIVSFASSNSFFGFFLFYVYVARSYCYINYNEACSRPCTAGFYCLSGTGPVQTVPIECSAGYYCPAGSSTLNQGGPCPAGYYCPIGTAAATQFPCPAGTTSLPGSSACSLVTDAQWTRVAPLLAGYDPLAAA